jgi:AraC-like DNA-binding protein
MKHAHTIHFLHHGSEESGLGRITTVARLDDSDGTPGIELRKLGSYALVYVQNGSGIYEDPQQTLKVNAGDLILLRPEVEHRYKPSEKTIWNEYFMLFEGPLFELWEQQGLFPENRPLLKLDPIELWLGRFKEIYAPGTTPLQQVTRLQDFLAEALTHDRYQVETQSTQVWIDRAKHTLETHLTNSEGVRHSAKAIGQSYDAFRKKFTRLTGHAPKHYMLNCQMEKAVRLLIETNLSSQAIAEQLGFCDQFHFSKRFKQHLGITPSKYRKRLKSMRSM